MFHGKIETDVAIKFAVSGISRVPFVSIPDLATRIGVPGERRRSFRCITGRVNRAARQRFSREQTMCVDNEPADVGFLQNNLQTQSVSAFRQPESGRLFAENVDISVASDQNLCTRGLARLLLKNWQQTMRGGAGDDFQHAPLSQFTKHCKQIAFPAINEEATTF